MATKQALQNELFETIWTAAVQRGLIAGGSHRPTPMMVCEHASPLDDNSPIRQSWVVEGGVCGFAWVIVKPGTSAFARWLSKRGYAAKHYYGGVSIWVHEFGQSMERKIKCAEAMADYLRSVGIKAYADSRMD